MEKKFYVEVNEIVRDWDVSRSKAYEMIKDLNKRLIEINPNAIIVKGRVNRKFYEESCYGQEGKDDDEN